MVSMIDNKSLIGAVILGAGAGLILHFILCDRHGHDKSKEKHHKSYFARFGGGFHPHFYGGFAGGGWRGGWGGRWPRFGNPYLPYLLPYLATSMYAPPPPWSPPAPPSFNSLFPQVSGVGGGFPM